MFTTTLLDFDALAANCELYMLLPLTASVLLYLRGFETARATAELLAARARCVGVAILYKYQAAVQLPLYAVAPRRSCTAAGRHACSQAGRRSALGVGGAHPGDALGARSDAGRSSAALFWFTFNGAYIRQGFRLSEIAARRGAADLLRRSLPALLPLGPRRWRAALLRLANAAARTRPASSWSAGG